MHILHSLLASSEGLLKSKIQLVNSLYMCVYIYSKNVHVYIYMCCIINVGAEFEITMYNVGTDCRDYICCCLATAKLI